MDNQSDKSIKRRIAFVQVMMAALIAVIGIKSFDIQIFKAEELAQKAENDYSRALTIKGERGLILDRRMNKLATSMDAISVSASPAKIENPKQTARKLSKILDIPYGKLAKKGVEFLFAADVVIMAEGG